MNCFAKWNSESLCTAKRRCGASLFLLIALIFVALSVASYVINVAYCQYTRAEMQIATDLATRAACRALVDTKSTNAAYEAAGRLAELNPVAGQTLVFGAGDLEFAAAKRYAESDTYSYQLDSNPNSVRICSKFFERSENSIGMLFPVFGEKTNFRPSKEAVAAQAELDLAIVLDCSESMKSSLNERSPDEPLTGLLSPIPVDARWRVARSGLEQSLQSFASSPQAERVAFVSFSSVSLLNVGLTDQYTEVLASLAAQETAYIGGRTSIADGLTSAITLLSNPMKARPWASRIILLISDGNNSFGGDVEAVARKAAASHLMIYTVSLSNEADQAMMSRLAYLGHGRHCHATSADAFVQFMEEINEHLPILLTK